MTSGPWLDELLTGGGAIAVSKDSEALPTRAFLNFIDAEETVEDDPANDRINVDIGAIMGRAKSYKITVDDVELDGTVSFATSWTTDPVKVAGNSYGITIEFAGTVAGTFKLQFANKNIADVDESAWTDLGTLSEIDAGAGSPATWEVNEAAYNLARVVYTRVSGTMTGIDADVTSKGGA